MKRSSSNSFVPHAALETDMSKHLLLTSLIMVLAQPVWADPEHDRCRAPELSQPSEDLLTVIRTLQEENRDLRRLLQAKWNKPRPLVFERAEAQRAVFIPPAF
jgi:hypothetical protein